MCILEQNSCFTFLGLEGWPVRCHLPLRLGFGTLRVKSVCAGAAAVPGSAESSVAGAQLRAWQLGTVPPRLAQPARSPRRCEERRQAQRPANTRGASGRPRDPLYPEREYLLLNRFKEVNWAGMYAVVLRL